MLLPYVYYSEFLSFICLSCFLKDGYIKLWNTRSGSDVEKLREDGRVARALAWSRTEDHVLAAGELTVHAKERVDTQDALH